MSEESKPDFVILSDLEGTLRLDYAYLHKDLADAYGTIKDNYNVKIYLITTHTSSDYNLGLYNLRGIHQNVIKPAHLEDDILLSDGVFHASEKGLEKAERGSFPSHIISRGLPHMYKILADYFNVNAEQLVLVDDNRDNRQMAELGHARAVPPSAEALLALFQNGVDPGMNKAHRPAPA